jgi:two-component system clock-associated histidine kinase SasA
MLLQLLLFIDERPSSQENIQQVQDYLQSLRTEYSFGLQVIEIRQQPYLVEHFKLVATPALVKFFPEPQQILAGSNLVNHLKKWWPRWQLALQEQNVNFAKHKEIDRATASEMRALGHSTELMRLSDEIFRLKQEKEELLEQLKFKDQVLAMLAHDLRSPLTAASMAVETLELSQKQENTERTARLKEQLYQRARQQFRFMNRIISDILQASKSMSSQLQVQYNQLYLQSLCQEILTQFVPQFHKKAQILEADIPQDLPSVYADAELIRQVIVNLLENAIKYTPEGGKISLSILHRTSQKIQFSLCDTGPGIPEEQQEKVFEGHFRLQRDEAKEGYGLGLSLCRKIVRAHYGQIWVDSIPNQGSCFYFTLPVYQ